MSDALRFGLFSINSHACSLPATAVRIARLAESAGSTPSGRASTSSYPTPACRPRLSSRRADPRPLVALAFLAGQTTTVRLGTGIVILPQRNPLVLARQVASLDA